MTRVPRLVGSALAAALCGSGLAQVPVDAALTELVMPRAAAGGAQSALLQRYPDRAFPLTSGATVRLPLVVEEARWVAVFGTVELAPLADRLEAEGVRPVAVEMPDGALRGVAMVIANRYPRSNAGPFAELVVAFAVSDAPVRFRYRNPASLTVPVSDPRCQVMPWHLILTEPGPVESGRELWGFPKVVGALDFDERPGGSSRVRLGHRAVDPAGELLSMQVELDDRLSTRMRSARWTATALGARRAAALALAPFFPFHYVTPRALRQTRTTSFMAGIPTVHGFPEGASLRFSPDHPVGRWMDQLGFEARTVQHAEALQMVLLPDDPRCFVAAR